MELASFPNIAEIFFETTVQTLNLKRSRAQLPDSSSLREVIDFLQTNLVKPHRVALMSDQMSLSHVFTQTDIINFARYKKDVLGSYVRPFFFMIISILI